MEINHICLLLIKIKLYYHSSIYHEKYEKSTQKTQKTLKQLENTLEEIKIEIKNLKEKSIAVFALASSSLKPNILNT